MPYAVTCQVKVEMSAKGKKSEADLARPEVACALVPRGAEDLLALDLTELTYGH